MNKHYDYAIVGAGCAGLSLAVRLGRLVGRDQRIALIDPRPSYGMDRIWCFWNTIPHPFVPVVKHRWQRWKVRFEGREVVHASSRFAYNYLPADAFYAAAFDQLEKYAAFDLLLGTAADSIAAHRGGAVVGTDKGDLQARIAFDGRNDAGRWKGRGLLLQHYAGQRVQVATPVFDPGTVTLMDFDVTQQNGISFVYVLPFSETEALIEPTVFSRAPLATETYTELIRRYLDERYGIEDYAVRFQEQGVIPMTTTLAPPRRLDRVVPLGTGAGMVKGSTGYGFLAIQEWSRTLAAAAVRGPGTSLPRPRSLRATFMDRVFLAFLEARPAAAPEIFFNLFRRVPADRLVRFLSDRATPIDVSAVVKAMPKAPFLRRAGDVILEGI
ncbi:MAG: lycopene cyclase family protein [Desulfobacterales bacterium]|nr:lycopene cyclase family protein [Desulfobacterales bacterium]